MKFPLISTCLLCAAAACASGQSREVAFIDSAVANTSALRAALRPDVEVVMLDARGDELAQISDTLRARRDLAVVHVFAHGAPGALQLGAQRLDVAALQAQGDAVQGWQAAFAARGALRLYGCDVGQGAAGRAFVAGLARLTGASVAASINKTGAAAEGGDWDLELTAGPAAGASPFATQPDFAGLLPTTRTESYQFTLWVRPGGTSYNFQFGTYTNSTPQTFNITQAAWFSVPDAGFGWFLERGKFQYSTNGGSTWTDYTVNGSSSAVYINTAGTLFRFVDQTPGDTTNSDQIGHGLTLGGGGGSVGGSGTTISVDNAPTDITVSTTGLFTDTAVGGTIATATPTDTGLSTGGYWAIDSQSVANLFTLSFDTSVNSTATLKLGTGTRPAVGQTATVTLRYYDLYQTDSSGNPISGQGFAKTFTFTVVNDSTTDLAGFSSEFHANSTTANAQATPAIARLSTGSYVVAWRSVGQENDATSTGGIYARVFSSAGAAQSSEIRISPLDAVNQAAPSVAALSNGRYVVAYTDAGNSNDVIYRLVAADNTVGSALTAHATTTGAQSNARVAALSNGNFAIAWINPDNSNDISARVFSGTDGSAVGNEFTVNATTTGAQSLPDVAGLANGEFVVTWRDPANSGDIFARRANASGTLGSEITVATGANNQTNARVAGFADGTFVVTYSEPSLDGDSSSENNIYFRRYDATGTAAGSATRANAAAAANQVTPVIAGFSNGGFVVAWSSNVYDYENNGVFGRRFDSAGAAIDTTDFQVNEKRHFSQTAPAITAGTTSAFAAAWTDSAEEGASNTGVEARVFNGNTAPTISDVANQSTSVGVATSALAVTVGDAETAVGSLTLAGSSSNTTLVPNANIVFGGSGASRTVTVTPAAGQSGTATITLTVTDGGGLTATDTFTLTVSDTTAPTIASVQRLSPTGQVTNATSVTFRVTYSEAVTNVSASNFAVQGVNGGTVNGTISVTGTDGTATRDVTVSSLTGSGEFTLKVVN